MGYAQLISRAAGEAQTILAQTGGAEAGAKNALYNGAAFLCVYGMPQVQRIILPGGGYRQRTYLQITATRSQFSAPPVANVKWVRTDLAPNVTYQIEKVDQHDANVFTLTVFRAGE